jgi:AcrR family transcriptional regulator
MKARYDTKSLSSLTDKLNYVKILNNVQGRRLNMVSRNRRERAKEELRRNILLAARKIALAEGWQSVTVRKIADQVEYSAGAIYEYFDSKEAILRAMMEQGFRQMLATLKNLRNEEPRSSDYLIALGRAYWQFAWQNPELYQVMHGLGGVPFGTPTAPTDAKALFELVREAVQAARHEIGIQAPVTDEMIEIGWATLHGLVSLSMSGRIPTENWMDKYPLVDQAMQLLINSWSD